MKKRQHIPNIEKALNIIVTKSGRKFRADAMILPGTPPIGIGKSEEEAKYNLLVNILYLMATNRDKYGRKISNEVYGDIAEKAIKEDWEKMS